MLVIFLLVPARSFFLGFGSGVEWYVSALIRAVQTREGSDCVYHSGRGSVTLWRLRGEFQWC